MRWLVQTAFALIPLLGFAPGSAQAMDYSPATKAQIDVDTDATLSALYTSYPGSKDIMARAAGVLVFPEPSFIVGGQHGGGELRVGGQTVGYYSTGGLEDGPRKHAMAVAFMTKDALQRFQASDGWDVSADGSVAVVKSGAEGKASQTDKPVQVFIYHNQDQTGVAALQGTKITKVD